MTESRREFLAKGSLGLVAAVVSQGVPEAVGQTPATQAPAPTPGAPPAFGTAPAVGPAVSVGTFVEAEKLVQVTMSPAERAQAAGNWQQSMAALFERRVGPWKVVLGEADVPATVWNPSLRAPISKPAGTRTIAVDNGSPKLPASDSEIAFSSVSQLGDWIRHRELTSERLTRIYLKRLKEFQPRLNCVITLTEDHALKQARAADVEIAAGKYRGPLHGIPWGAKDLLDTAGIATTWGAEFHRNRVPAKDATVTTKLNDAGAVLVAKLSLGSLALNDVWFGGQTKNPWNLDEGASGSSAGPGSAVAAGLLGFAIGSETQGSIISPSMRCGVTGLRPTFGRVSRAGAMTLSWTCDKLGPMARHVYDTLLVLEAISGYDEADTASVTTAQNLDVKSDPMTGLRVGYIPKWMSDAPATDVDRHALETCAKLGMKTVPITLPDWPYDSLNTILFAEAAAAFEHYAGPSC